MKKFQLPVIGGIRKVLTQQTTTPGTTIAELGSGSVTLAQLAAIITQIQAQQQNNGGGNIGDGTEAVLKVGPGLSGGGPMLGTVLLNLTAPIPWGLDMDGGGGDGDPGPPGMAGAAGHIGLTGGTGPVGPAVFMAAEDGQDGQDAVPGAPGAAGSQGNPGANGASGLPGAAIYMVADDGQDGQDAIPGPRGVNGTNGSNGATGGIGPAGPAIFMAAEDGQDGDIIPGPPGAPGAGTATVTPVPATIADLAFWFKSDPILATSGVQTPCLQNYTPWGLGNSAVSQGGGAALSATQLNSLNVLTFSGVSAERYAFEAAIQLTNFTAFFVIKPSSIASGDFLGGNGGCIGYGLNGGSNVYISIDNVALIATSTNPPTNAAWNQINVVYNSGTGAYAFRQAQAANGSGSSAHAVTSPNLSLLWNTVTGGTNFAGDVAEVIIYNRDLTLVQIQSVEAYIHTKWGV